MDVLDTRPPLFIDSEKHECDKRITELATGRYNLFCLRCHNMGGNPEQPELVAASYLLMNVMLMSRSRRKILKMVTLGVEGELSRYAHTNIMRELLNGDFSSLANIESWHRILAARTDIPESLFLEVERAVDFFEGAEIASSASEFHRAHVYIAIEGTTVDDPMGGQFTLKAGNLYNPVIVGLTARHPVGLNSVFTADGVTIRTGNRGQNVMVELDCALLLAGVRNWMGNIERILNLDFYRAGIA
jgi:hypothetical protein